MKLRLGLVLLLVLLVPASAAAAKPWIGVRGRLRAVARQSRR